MNLNELDELFNDTANRTWGVFYYCSADPRVIAPSRPTWRGYQINFAHAHAVHVLVFYLIVLFGPVSIAFAFGPGNAVMTAVFVFLAFTGSIGLLMAISAYLSRQHDDRPEE